MQSWMSVLIFLAITADLVGSVRHRIKRFNQPNRDMACEMLIAFDEPLFRHFRSDLRKVTEVAQDEVRQLNEIYQRTLLTGSKFGRIYFRIKEIRIMFDFCTECNQTQEIFLSEFSQHVDTSPFCLAHLFTYRDFPRGVQGLAWKGTLCKDAFNTGFTTLLNNKVRECFVRKKPRH